MKRKLLLLTAFLLVSSVAHAWTVDSLTFTKRKAVTIDNANVDATLTDFPVLVKITDDTDLGAVMQADGDDIRFTTSDGTLCTKEPEAFRLHSADSLLLHLDGADTATATTDSGETLKTISFVGSAQLDTAQKKFGASSILFDGADDYITASYSAGYNFGSGNFTIDYWVRFNALPSAGNYMMQIGQWANGTNKGWIPILHNTAGNYTWEFFYTTDGSTNKYASFATTVSTNTWYHISFVRSGSNLYCFQDGAQCGSAYNISTDSIYASTLPVSVGCDTTASTPLYDMNGWVDEVRVLKGTAVWTSNFTPPTAAYTHPLASGLWWVKVPSVSTSADTTIYAYYGNADATAQTGSPWDANFKAVWHHNDNAANTTLTDATGTYNGTLSANSDTLDATGQVGGALNYGGTATATVAHNTDLNLTSGLTFSAWLYPGAADEAGYILSKTDYSTAGGWGFYWDGNTNQLRFYVGSSTSYTSSANFTESGSFVYCTWTCNGSGNIAYFKNGGAQGTSSKGSALGTNTIGLVFSNRTGGSSAATYWNGYTDESRLSSGVRSDAWIKFEHANMSEADNEISWGVEEDAPAAPANTGNFFQFL